MCFGVQIEDCVLKFANLRFLLSSFLLYFAQKQAGF